MPRKPRLDVPGTLHHVIVRGIEQSPVFTDDQDRQHFKERLEKLVDETGTKIYAWAMIPNHFHLLVRSSPKGLPTFMRRLLTGYATKFNKRHKRHGHLFQNRYRSIICDEEPYTGVSSSREFFWGVGRNSPVEGSYDQWEAFRKRSHAKEKATVC
jgi:putative transposase